MKEYEQPQVLILEFLSQITLATDLANDPSVANDEIDLNQKPSLEEDVGDW